ncbi:MAG: alpha/beta hydrolase, partial [Gemmatimonadaceae bacterium]|nr:alpha/beta hydrolase [Acetobacteraceae bacterium]
MAAQPAPAAAPVLTQGRLELADVTLHYIEAGSGEPVVLLHGFAETSREWEGVMAR